MKKFAKTMERLENWLLIITFVVMVVAFFTQVLNRNFFQLPLPWLEELAVFCMIYMIMLGTEAGLRDGSQIAVTAIVDRFKGRSRIALRAFAKFIIVAFSAAVLINSVSLINRQLAAGQTSASLGIPMAVPYFGITLAFAVITIIQGVLLVQLVIDLVKGSTEDEMSDELTLVEEGELQ